MQTHRRYDFKNQHFVGEEGRLIPLLQQAQAEDGYLRRERMVEIHEISGIPLAHIYGVATFYAQFRLKPVGRFADASGAPQNLHGVSTVRLRSQVGQA